MRGHLRLRPIMAVLAAASVVASGGAVAVARGSATPDLPPVSPARLIGSVVHAMAAEPAVSGEVRASIDLGIPQLPTGFGTALSGPAALIASLQGDHRVRLWRSPDGLRVAELLNAGERSVWVSRSAAWAWDSASYTAYRLFDASEASSRVATGAGASGGLGTGVERQRLMDLLDPDSLAQRTLAAASPSTSVVMGVPRRVAGRDAYVLAVVPRTSATLVGRIEISVDAERWIPLGVSVYARGAADPSISVAYSSVSFDPIDPSTYRFVPPAGATISEPKEGVGTARLRVAPLVTDDVRVIGTGWATIVAVRVPASALRRTGASLDLAQLLPFSGPLFSVRQALRGDHAWILAGAVPQAALASAGLALP